MFGLLNLAKPKGMTSRQVVNLVQRQVKPDKVGHAGTLDPLATGVLVVCVGAATRLIEYVQRMPKRYRGTFLLGRQSDTEDIEGEVQSLDNPPVPTRAAIEEAATQLLGEIQQRPPQYSALKVAGKRAYDLARQGQQVELAARPVTIHRLDVLRYEYPELELEVECSSGTYIRSLGRDLAESVSTAAVMSELVRSGVGRFGLEDACDPRELDRAGIEANLRRPLEALAELPRTIVTEAEMRAIRDGKIVTRPGLVDAEEMVAVTELGELVAILQPQGTNLWRPAKGFAHLLLE